MQRLRRKMSRVPRGFEYEKCLNGHIYAEVGFYIWKRKKRRPMRRCKACHKLAQVRYETRKFGIELPIGPKV